MPCSLTRVVAFHATHRYDVPSWSAEENRARFGWTNDAPGHGHLYRITVTVVGPLDPTTAMVMDLAVLDAILAAEVVTPLAGRHLNAAVPEFVVGSALPTCEAIAVWCFGRVRARLPEGVSLERVRVAEDETLWADCTGPA